ncbi:MAG: Unknown protein, partial [uncultured Sulfurovum sp.]
VADTTNGTSEIIDSDDNNEVADTTNGTSETIDSDDNNEVADTTNGTSETIDSDDNNEVADTTNGTRETIDLDDNNEVADDINNTTTPTLPIEYKADAGRLLGSQCAQCHGTNGISVNSWDSIAGESDLADEIFDDEPIMTAQAHGYTSEEIALIGTWLKTLNQGNESVESNFEENESEENEND